MESVLIISSIDKDKELLTDLCRAGSISKICTASSADEARGVFKGDSYDLVIINSPLADESGSELAIYISNTTCSGVLMFVKSEHSETISSKVEEYGVFVLQKPISRTLFFQAIKLISASCKRFQGLHKQTVKLESKIDEICLVNRAKCALIQYLSMTESQAHRYIEKQAMDMRLPKRAVAESILNTYEY